MIFNNETSYSDTGYVSESKYPLGLEGALMHVYENECNYNAIMRSVGISELRYYQETGGDLFVQEAGALSGFFNKIKDFFKKVIEKIKSIFHKFMAVINSYTMSDKQFVKKYEKELYRRDLRDMEFNGYTFKHIDFDIKIAMSKDDLVKKTDKTNKYITDPIDKTQIHYNYDDDSDLDDEIEKDRGLMLNMGPLTEEEFRDEIKEKLYGGEKEPIEITNIRDYLSIITNTSESIKKAERSQKDIVRAVDNFIKALEKYQSNLGRLTQNEKDKNLTDDKNTAVKNISNIINKQKAISNDYTIFFGMKVQALKDQNRQAKAICVKALSYKHEAASVYGESYTDDIFSGVTIR